MPGTEGGGEGGDATHLHAPSSDEVVPIAEDDPRLARPGRVTAAPVDPQLRLLPTHEMDWPDFERLLLRIAREVQGLRSVKLFGNPGQAQDGLDVIGLNAAGQPEGVQGKRYAKFTKDDLNAAVRKYVEGGIPFDVVRLAVGVSCEANERKVVERLVELNRQHPDIVIELWDRQRISEMLRDRPEIVLEFFSAATAESFCAPYRIATAVVPGPDAVATADAVALGPESSGEAQRELAAAAEIEAQDPAQALAHLQHARDRLTETGFPAHAQVLDQRVVDLLIRLDLAADAARLLLDRFWDALADGRSYEAEEAKRALDRLTESQSDHHDDAAADDPVVRAAGVVADAALSITEHPLAQLPAFEELTADGAAVDDRARLVLLAAETALAAGDDAWAREHAEHLVGLAQAASDTPVAVRLEIAAAEASGDWSGLLQRARTRGIPRELVALVLARRGCYLAVRGEFRGADEAWIEAVEQACLAGYNADAANWLYSRRTLASRYTVLVDDQFHPLAAALDSRATLPQVAAARNRPRERALEALQRGQHRRAALALRRHLRDAVVSGSWADEHDARSLLADLHQETGDLAVAAKQLVLAGEGKRAFELGKASGDEYLDVREHLVSLTYWTRATAFRLIAAQADLVPDPHVDGVVEQALGVLDEAANETLVDTPLFAPSVRLAAYEALAGLADRLCEDQARKLLDHLEPYADAWPNHGWHTDEAHAAACDAIARTHPALAGVALDQLVRVFARASHALKASASELLVENVDVVEDRLRPLSAGNFRAAELLAYARPEAVGPADMEEAAQRLIAPLSSGPGVYAMGTGAVGDSMIAAGLPASRRAELIEEQLSRARSPYESAHDRSSYLLAAANLASELQADDVERLLPAALAEAVEPPESEADAVTAQFRHPLSAFRVTGNHDSRPAAAFLAARLARTPEQRDLARNAALSLIGADGDADYHVTRALRVLQDDLERDVPLLMGFGWALRSLAAISWARSQSLDPRIGRRLAADPDPRVRRALADALSGTEPDERTAAARERLHSDARHSVRARLQGSTHSATGRSETDAPDPL